jgi:hypothetical protein
MLLLALWLQLAAAQAPAPSVAPAPPTEPSAPSAAAATLSKTELGEYRLFTPRNASGSTDLSSIGSATASVGGGGGGGDKWNSSSGSTFPSLYRGAKIIIPDGARFHYVRDDHFTRLGRDPQRIVGSGNFGPFGPAAIVNVRKNAAYDFFVGCTSGTKEQLVSFDGASSVKSVSLSCP